MTHLFKIDTSTDPIWNFAVFKSRPGLFGCRVWDEVFKSDHLGCCREYVAEALKLPEFYGEAPD